MTRRVDPEPKRCCVCGEPLHRVGAGHEFNCIREAWRRDAERHRAAAGGAIEALTRKTWTIRHMLRNGAIDTRAALTSLRLIEDCAPENLRRLASKTIREVTGAPR